MLQKRKSKPKLRNPKKQLDCYGIEPKSKLGKISFLRPSFKLPNDNIGKL